MEKTIVVKRTEIRTGAKGEYLVVYPLEGKAFNEFEQSRWNLYGDGLAVKVIGEQNGPYFNVSDAEPSELPPESSQVKSYNETEIYNIRKSALNQAVTFLVAKVQQSKEVKSSHVLDLAILFESYITNGAVIEKREE